MNPQPSPVFIADALALDFLNTVAAPMDETIDFLGSGEGLLDWLGRARLVPDVALRQLRERDEPGVLDEMAARARELREWFRVFVHERKGRSLKAEDMQVAETLNRILASDDSFTRLEPRDDGGKSPLRLEVVRRCRAPETLLIPIAEMLARFLCEQNLAFVKYCEGPGCDLLFVDPRRQGARRWCSMAMCGNRAKQAAHRSRTKGQGL